MPLVLDASSWPSIFTAISAAAAVVVTLATCPPSRSSTMPDSATESRY